VNGDRTEQAFRERGRPGWPRILAKLAESRKPHRAIRILSYALLGGLVGVFVLAAAALLPTLFGYHAYIVYGGSMAPSLKLGSVAIGKPVKAQELEIGDVIVRHWSADSSPVLHRIVGITNEGGQYLFITQGDMNDYPDVTPVSFEDKGDKIVYSVPYIGFLFHFARTRAGLLSLVAAPTGLLLIQAVWYIRSAIRRGLAGARCV
jgi:signal peptidase